MGALQCTVGIYADIESAIGELRRLAPASSVITWWEREGKFLNNLVPVENIPVVDQAVVTDNIQYVRSVLVDAIETDDVADIEYVVTRLVSNIEDIASRYKGWIYPDKKLDDIETRRPRRFGSPLWARPMGRGPQ